MEEQSNQNRAQWSSTVTCLILPMSCIAGESPGVSCNFLLIKFQILVVSRLFFWGCAANGRKETMRVTGAAGMTSRFPRLFGAPFRRALGTATVVRPVARFVHYVVAPLSPGSVLWVDGKCQKVRLVMSKNRKIRPIFGNKALPILGCKFLQIWRKLAFP